MSERTKREWNVIWDGDNVMEEINKIPEAYRHTAKFSIDDSGSCAAIEYWIPWTCELYQRKDKDASTS